MEGERGDGAGKAGWGGVMVGVQPGGLRREAGDGSGLEGSSLPPEPCPPAPEVTLPPSPAAELGGETP